MRDLLEPLAPDVDVDAGWSAVDRRMVTVRRRRRRVHRALAATVAMAVVAGGLALASRGDDPERRIETGPAADADPTDEVLVELPDGWQRAEENLTPSLTDPLEVLTVGTGPLLVDGAEDCGRAPGRSLQAMGPDDALVWVARAGPVSRGPVRPPALQPTVPTAPAEDPSIPDCTDRHDLHLSWTTFSQQAEVYYLLVAVSPTASDDTRAETVRVLESLRFRPPASEELPRGWQEADRILTPILGEGRGREWEAFAAGTYPLVPNGPGARCAQWPVTALEQLGPEDALVWAIRPTGHPPHPPRPSEFNRLPTGPIPNSDITECLRRAPDLAYDTYSYEEDGQNVIVLVALGLDADEQTRSEALDVLNGLDVTDGEAFRVAGAGAGVSGHRPTGWRVAGRLTTQDGTDDYTQIAAFATYDLVADPASCSELGRPAFDQYVDNGRLINVHVLVGEETSAATEQDAIALLNSLRFEPD